MSVDAFEQALARFDQLAPKARNLADGGDPSALERLVDRVVGGDRMLADEGALREVRSLAPGTADRFASYLAFPFAREARLRKAFAGTELTAGKVKWTAAQAMARVRLGDAAERSSALSALAALDETIDRFEELAPEAAPRKVATPAAEPAKSGSILLPTPALMAELGLVSSAPVARAEAGPDRSREVGELVLELAESAAGRRPIEYGELRSIGRDVADFRVRHPLLAGKPALQFEQPGAPLGRVGARAIELGDPLSSAGALLGSEGVAGGALAFAGMTLVFGGCFADAGRDRRRTARAFAAAVGAMALECHLVGRAATVEDVLDRERDSLGFSRPLRLGRLLWAGARFEEAPGEDTARYAGGARLEGLLGKGAALALDLRDRFDEDWFRNPRVSREVLEDAGRATPGSIDQVNVWLKESARL